MKKISLIASLLALALATTTAPVMARDSVGFYPIEAALKGSEGTQKVDPLLPLYFAGQTHAAVASSLGRVSTIKKTNALGHSDNDACEHVFLSAVLQLQSAAKAAGADAVIDIRSNYENKPRASATEYTCGAGAVVAGVTLTGELVKLAK